MVAYWCMSLFLAFMFLPFFGIFVSFLFFFISLFTLHPFLSILLSFCLLFFSSLFSLCTPMAFYTTCRDRIYHFYPLTTFSSLWVPSKTAHWSVGCSATTITLRRLHHALFPDKKVLVLPLTSLNTLIRIRVKPLPY